MAESDEKTLSPEIVQDLQKIFGDQNWSLEIEEEKILFNRFCSMLKCLSKEQQWCVLETTRNFLRIEFNDYYYHIKQCLSKIDPKSVDGITHIYIAPMTLGMPDETGGKSSGFLSYMLKNSTAMATTILSDKSLFTIEKLAGLPKNFNSRPRLLFLVDDFIGSGETVSRCIEYLKENNINLNKVIVLSLVIQNIGFEKIKNMGPKIVYSVFRKKGISDSYETPKKEKMIRIMISIEALLKINPENRFGYRQTEALVKMMRTPNNTFPVFWKDQKLADGSNFYSPFPRN
jgi:hypothetical protein